MWVAPLHLIEVSETPGKRCKPEVRIQVSQRTDRSSGIRGANFLFTRPQTIANESNFLDERPVCLVRRPAHPIHRKSINYAIRISTWLLPKPKGLALGGLLVFGALLTAAALRLPDQQWLAWISFLPLFVVVRSARPLPAALAGGFWGGCLYLFVSAGIAPAAPTIGGAAGLAASAGPSAWLFGLMIAIPAVYVGLAARPGRIIGYKLLTLALGWTLIEVVLHLYNSFTPQDGLLTGSQTEAQQFHWLPRLLGYVSTAFLVACVNASLLGVVTAARLNLPAGRSWDLSPGPVGWLLSQVFPAIQSGTLCQAHPRAPPISTPPVS